MLRLKKALLSIFCLALFANLALAQDLGEGKKDPKEPKQVSKIIRLKPVSASDATGFVKVVFAMKKEGDPIQQFELITVNLSNKSTYKLFVDGMEITSREAKAAKGEGEPVFTIEFSSKNKDGGKKGGSANGLPASLDPITKIRHIEVRDLNNQVILAGDFTE